MPRSNVVYPFGFPVFVDGLELSWIQRELYNLNNNFSGYEFFAVPQTWETLPPGRFEPISRDNGSHVLRYQQTGSDLVLEFPLIAAETVDKLAENAVNYSDEIEQWSLANLTGLIPWHQP